MTVLSAVVLFLTSLSPFTRERTHNAEHQRPYEKDLQPVIDTGIVDPVARGRAPL